MRSYPLIAELEIREVANKGVPNSECIVIKPIMSVDMAPFAVCVGMRSLNFVTPVRDLFFWFGEGTVHPADWIFLYTGSGKASRLSIGEGHAGNYIFCYWGRSTTLFHDNMYTPFLMRFDAIKIALPPPALPQLPQ
jgi:hypothetical protein